MAWLGLGPTEYCICLPWLGIVVSTVLSGIIVQRPLENSASKTVMHVVIEKGNSKPRTMPWESVITKCAKLSLGLSYTMLSYIITLIDITYLEKCSYYPSMVPVQW